MNKKDRVEKIRFIFETGKELRFHLEGQVMASGEGDVLCAELSGVQLKAAMQVSAHQPMGLNQLAAKMGVSAPSASALVDRLVEKEVLSRETDPTDRRKVVLRIHPKAEAHMAAMHQRFQNAFERLARRVGDENVDRWFQVMQQIHAILEEENPHE
jgi:DNA-binding MarR family transcriptional regulator